MGLISVRFQRLIITPEDGASNDLWKMQFFPGKNKSKKFAIPYFFLKEKVVTKSNCIQG